MYALIYFLGACSNLLLMKTVASNAWCAHRIATVVCWWMALAPHKAWITCICICILYSCLCFVFVFGIIATVVCWLIVAPQKAWMVYICIYILHSLSLRERKAWIRCCLSVAHCILKFRQIHFSSWTNTFWYFDKYYGGLADGCAAQSMNTLLVRRALSHFSLQ